MPFHVVSLTHADHVIFILNSAHLLFDPITVPGANSIRHALPMSFLSVFTIFQLVLGLRFVTQGLTSHLPMPDHVLPSEAAMHD